MKKKDEYDKKNTVKIIYCAKNTKNAKMKKGDKKKKGNN